MPRASKRVAARQAELSKKKRHKNPPRVAAGEPQATAAGPAPSASQIVEDGNGAAAGTRTAAPPVQPRAHAPASADGEPSFRVPTRSRVKPAGAETSRRVMPQLPFLRQDLVTLSIITMLMIVVLVVLDLVVL